MTDDTQNDTQPAKEIPAAAAEGIAALGGNPNVPSEEQKLAKAKEGGYVEEPAPSFRVRVETLVASFEHAMAHNAPVTPPMLAEMKAILLGE